MVGSLVNLGRVIVEEGGEGTGDGYASCIRGRERGRERIVGVEYPVCVFIDQS